jgi:general stress protein 26
MAAAREVMEEARLAALITLDERGSPRARTMDAFAPDEHMVVWLGTHRATRKVVDIRRDPRVALYYVAPDGNGYVSVTGLAELVDDPAERATRWKAEWDQYYTDREAQYLLIRVRPVRLEVVNYRRGVVGDSATWRPPALEFERR